MQNILLFARGDFVDIAAVVIFIVVGVIRFLYGIMKKPDVPGGAPQQQAAAPKTPEALQQEIEKFIRQAQGREAKPAPLPKQIVVEQRPPEPIVRQRLPAEERRDTKPREQNRPKPKKNRTETQAPDLASTPLSKRHVIDAEVQQSLGENRPRRSEKPNANAIEQHMKSAFSHKVGSLDSDVEDRSVSSVTTTAGKKKEQLKFTKDQIRQAIIFNEILMRPKFED